MLRISTTAVALLQKGARKSVKIVFGLQYLIFRWPRSERTYNAIIEYCVIQAKRANLHSGLGCR